MSLNPGTKLGPYEILSPLGAGGMGEVYRAKDTRLGREVAIKVLPEALANDADRLRRFQQEAQAVAALNHPNILSIHDFGQHEGSPFLVSELLEGQTLREALEAGSMTVRRAIEYALGIAKGLAAAHEKGIVHRDLKPENVFITNDGRVKVLDFGLAKLVRPEESNDTVVTLANPATLPGTVMGTVGYMSPEQIRGGASDARSDIFSFGAVLYEMLTGKRAFKRDTSAETMTAILREEPPELIETGWQGPLGLQRILGRCLEKNVERRFQSASDLAFAIESLSGSSSISGVTSSAPSLLPLPLPEEPSRVRGWMLWSAAFAGVLLVAAAWFAGRSASARPPLKYTRLTYQQGHLSNARFARDGQTIVYSAQWGNGPMQVYTVRREFPQSTKVDLPSASLLALSVDGNMEIVVDPTYSSWFTTGTMSEAQMVGGTPRAQDKNVIAADYAPDGKSLALVHEIDRKVQLEYPAGKVIYSGTGYMDYVRVSPSGKQVAFLEHPIYGDDRGWVSIVDDAGHHQQLTQEFATVQGLAWSAKGNEIWFTGNERGADRQVFGVTLAGKVRSVLTNPLGTRILDVAPDGRVLLLNERQETDISGIDPATGKERRGLEWFDGSAVNDITPDGKAISFLEWGGPAGPLYINGYRKMDGSAPVALGAGAFGVFSPDGATVATYVPSRPPQIALNPVGAGASRQLVPGDVTNLRGGIAWFPDGKHLLLTGAPEGQPSRTYIMDIEGGKPQVLGPPGFLGIAVARDSKRIAGRDATETAVVFDRETEKVQPIPGIDLQEHIQRWTDDGQALIVYTATAWDGNIYRVEVATGKRALLQHIELSEKAGSLLPLRLAYAERSKTYAYTVTRDYGILYVAEGLE